MVLRISLPDVPAVAPPSLYELLQALRKQVVSNTNLIADAFDAIGAAGGGGDIVTTLERDPPSLVLDYDATNNISVSADAAFAAYKFDAAAKDVYLRAGEYSTTQARPYFTKRHRGPGQIVGSSPTPYVAPANLRYLSVMPTVAAVQGELGWFAGDQTFAEPEWRILGPTVRDYDPDARYFESAVIPHHAWWDVESGSSGIVGYATGGVVAGNTITLSTGTDPAWVGKKAYIKDRFGGIIISDTHAGTAGDPHVPLTIASVAGNVVTFTTPHTASMAWNPTGGDAPCLTLSNRTWGGFDYLRIRMRGGGDVYGRIVRVNIDYVPKTYELGHVFNTGTGGQFGGSADFAAGAVGTMTTGWESQYTSASADVAVYAQVDSFTRGNDRADGGGRVWIGVTMNSGGPRPSDAAYVLTGPWRRGLDTTGAFLNDGSYLTAAAGAGATTISVKWSAGARKNYPINITHPTTPYFGTVVSFTSTTVTVTPAMPITYPIDSLVNFDGTGGAAVIMKVGQSINWDGVQSQSARGSDPLGVFGVAYGNQTGVIWSGAETDGTPYWATYNDTARIRLRPTSFSVNVDTLVSGTLHVSEELITDTALDLPGGANYQGAVVFGSGLGEYLVFNRVSGKFEFYINDALVHSVP